jgi:PHD/YefM family antitoxin component YafN of YafNO toxin-antitoxin module
MKLSKAVKPISYIKSHASEVIRDLESSGEAIVITLNGEAKAIIQDIRQYEKTQESLAMLKILALGKKEAEEGKFQPMDKAFAEVRKILKEETR